MPTGGGGGGGAPKGWPVALFQNTAPNSGNFGMTANQVSVVGLVIPYQLTFAHIAVYVGVADATNNYDIGLYSQAGTLLANIGAQHVPSTTIQGFATVQGAITIQPGLYVFAWTGNANTLNLGGNNGAYVWIYNGSYAVSSGGALPASVTAFTVATASFSNVYPVIFLY